VAYTVTNRWSGGFQAEVKLTNTGTAAYDGWKLGWTFPGDQRIGQIWNASHQQTGAKVTVTDAGWNGKVAPGSSAAFGFTGTTTGDGTAPGAFTLGGEACAVG
jgi:cellulase/cellobiase CelA1